MEQFTDLWELYERGKDYKRHLDLYNIANANERMYIGDQWKGVVANGLPTPVFNIFKRCINFFVSAILSQAVKMQFSADNVPDSDPKHPAAEAAEIISAYSQTLWERLKMDSKLADALFDAAISGDADGHTLFDMTIDTGQVAAATGIDEEVIEEPIMGDLDFELVDNVNVFFGNPNDRRVEPQPWIIISFRALVSKLREEAQRYDVTPDQIQNIVPDTDYTEQAGDLGKIELDSIGGDGKTIALIKFWKKESVDEETGKKSTTVWWKKSTKSVEIIPETDMKITRYPIAHMNWDSRKNSYHGQAIGTGLIPNQIFINKMFAMVMLNMMNVAFPKAVYNSNYITEWSNQIGQAIPVSSGEDMTKIAHYLQPGNMANNILEVIELALRWTKDLIGVSDVSTGSNVTNPQNYAATVATQQASMIPLENIKRNLYQWVEDIGYIWLDFMIAKYGKRNITIEQNGKRVVVPFNFDDLKGIKFNLKVDVGPSSYWSEITAIQLLETLLDKDKISFLQYLERIPAGVIPKKEELIDELREQMQMQQQQMQQQIQQTGQQQEVEQFITQLPPEVQQQLADMPPEQSNAAIQQLMQVQGGAI